MNKNKKKLRLIALFLSLYTEGSAQTYGLQVLNGAQLVIEAGTTVTVVNSLGTKIDGVNSALNNSGTLAMEGSFLNQNSGVVQNGTYKIGGAFTNTATFAPVGTTVELNGTAASTISSTSAFNNLTINKEAAHPIVDVAAGLSINGTLNFTSGLLQTNAFTINMAATGTISGFDATKFIITNNALGGLSQRVSNTVTTYPVGTTSLSAPYTSYTPLSITEAAAAATSIKVNVQNNVSMNPNVGGSSNFTTGVVNKFWTVVQLGARSPHNLTLTTQWHTTDELRGFNRAQCSVALWNSDAAIWNLPSSTVGTSSGTNPYTRTRSGITSVGYFAVGSNAIILPLTLLDFTATADKQTAYLTWITSEAHNLSHFDIEKSVDGKNFIKIARRDAINQIATTLPTNRDTPSVYKAIDDQFLLSSYYRLKINELDGVSTYSKTLYLEKNSDTSIKIHCDTEGSVLIETDDKIDLITVTNTIGQALKSTKDKRFLMDEFNTGIYIISVKTDKGFLSKKIFKD